MIFMMFSTVCAFYVKGLCRFANTLVFTTILSFKIDNINISPVELLLGYPSNVLIAWKERKSVQWKVCIPLAVLVLAGNIPGILLWNYFFSQSSGKRTTDYGTGTGRGIHP